MTFSELKRLLEEYDAQKGFGRRLFGDAKPIKALRAFIEATNSSNDTNIQVSLADYRKFAANTVYGVELSEDYLNSGTASANLFKQWQRNEEFVQRVNNSSVVQIVQRLVLPDSLLNLANVISSISPEVSLQLYIASQNNFIARYLEAQQNNFIPYIFQHRDSNFSRPQPQHAEAPRNQRVFNYASAAPAA